MIDGLSRERLEQSRWHLQGIFSGLTDKVFRFWSKGQGRGRPKSVVSQASTWTLGHRSSSSSPCAIRTCHFQYNSRISCWIVTNYVPVETEINTLHKIYKFTSTVSSSTVVMIFGVRNGWSTDSCSAFERCCMQLSQKVAQCLSFQFLLGYSMMKMF